MKEIKDGNPITNSHWKISYSDNRPIIAIDFDHTITENCPACDPGKRKLQMGVKEALTELIKTFDIVVYSGGGYYLPNYNLVIERFLKEHNIPYTRVEINKPPAVFLIDDRAIHHKGWLSTMKEIHRRLECGTK